LRQQNVVFSGKFKVSIDMDGFKTALALRQISEEATDDMILGSLEKSAEQGVVSQTYMNHAMSQALREQLEVDGYQIDDIHDSTGVIGFKISW
jgi:hypothetical protein